MKIKSHLKSGSVLGFALFVLVTTNLSVKSYSSSDSFSQNLIFVEESAEIVLPIQSFEIKIWYSIQEESFHNASKESNKIFDSLEKKINSLGLSHITLIKGWGLPKRTENSFNSKGKTISTKMTIVVENCPKGILHIMLARIVDKVLAVDKAIVIEDIHTFPDEKFKLEKQKAVEKLTKNINKHCINIAKSLGHHTVSTKRIYISTREPENENVEPGYNWGFFDPDEEGDWGDDDVDLKKKIVQNQRLKFKTEIVDYQRLLITVKGVFEIN